MGAGTPNPTAHTMARRASRSARCSSAGSRAVPAKRSLGLPAAYVPYVLSAGRSRAVSTRSAKPGDIVIFKWDGGVVDHIGFVEANHGSYIQTIEGNTNNGRVARRTRAWNTIAAILRPAYSGSATSSGRRHRIQRRHGPAHGRRLLRAGHHPPLAAGHGHQRGRHHQRPVQAGLPDIGPTRARGLVRALRAWAADPPHPRRPTQAQPHRGMDSAAPPPSVLLQKHLGVAQDSWFGPAPPEHSKAASTPARSKNSATGSCIGVEALLHACVRRDSELVDRHLQRSPLFWPCRAP